MINGINTCLFYKGLRFKHNIEREKMSKGIIYERTCTRIKEDGYRCGKSYYSKRKTVGKNYCDECKLSQNNLTSRAGLTRSRNHYAKGGNDEKIRDFVINLMATHEDDKKTITRLKNMVESLSNRLTQIERDSEHQKLEKDVEKLKRQNTVNENKIKALKKLIHRMKTGE
jgi:ATP-dependent Lon protease